MRKNTAPKAARTARTVPAPAEDKREYRTIKGIIVSIRRETKTAFESGESFEAMSLKVKDMRSGMFYEVQLWEAAQGLLTGEVFDWESETTMLIDPLKAGLPVAVNGLYVKTAGNTPGVEFHKIKIFEPQALRVISAYGQTAAARVAAPAAAPKARAI